MDNIESMINAGQYDEAMAALDSAIGAATASGDDADATQAQYMARLYFLRGKLNWRMGRRREAVGDYSLAESLDPTSPAATALAQARDIMDFHAPDLYNP